MSVGVNINEAVGILFAQDFYVTNNLAVNGY